MDTCINEICYVFNFGLIKHLQYQNNVGNAVNYLLYILFNQYCVSKCIWI